MSEPTPRGAIRTPDQRLRVFISSTLKELAAERAAVAQAIRELRLTPVLFETGARPYPPRDLYRAYLAQSHIFVGIYWQQYGWVAPDMEISGLEDEYRLAEGLPRLIYIKTPSPERDPQLNRVLQGIKEGEAVSYRYFGTPEELHDLVANDLAVLLTERFAQPGAGAAPAVGRRGALPRPLTPLIAREGEIAALRALLAQPEARLITVTGPGGVGKTRLALAAAAEAAASFPDGATWVDLASVRDAERLVSAIAQALDVRETGGYPLRESLMDYLRSRRLLLVLDNFEQLRAAAPLLAEVLAAAPDVRALVTSRAALGVRGERLFSVAPLAVPQGPDASSPEEVLRSPAGRLFVARAEEAQPTFALSEANAGPVAEIVRRLEGLPLAMELAAARMRLLSPQALLARLTDRLGFLAGGAQDLPARQQTMRSVIDWSYALLSPAEQALLAQLAVFVGGFTLEAVEAVSADGGADPLAALDALVTNSLVYGGASTGAGSGAATAARFRLLETIREYAAERLAERGEEEAIRERHAAYYAELASRPRPYFFSSESEVWLDYTQAEVGNLRAALEWSQAPPERQPRAWQMTADLAWFWYRRGYLDEARRWCERAVAQTASHEGTLARAMALHSAGLVAMWQSDLPAARRLMDEGLATFAGLEEPAARAVALFGRGVLAVNQGETEDAVRFLEEALDVFQGPGADWFRAITLLHLGNAALERGDLGAAQGYHDRCLALSRSVGDRWLVASGVNNLGELARYRGEHSRAEGYYLESRDLFREVGSPPDVARETHSLAWVSLARGDAEEAAALFGEALALHQQAGVQRGVAECLLGFAAIHARAGRARKALSLAAHGRARLEGLGACIWPADALDLERHLQPARVALGAAEAERAEDEGRALDPAEALTLARRAGTAQEADALSAP